MWGENRGSRSVVDTDGSLRGDVNADSVVDANDVQDVEACQGKQNGIPIDSN
jgi:hypothetical protein